MQIPIRRPWGAGLAVAALVLTVMDLAQHYDVPPYEAGVVIPGPRH